MSSSSKTQTDGTAYKGHPLIPEDIANMLRTYRKEVLEDLTSVGLVRRSVKQLEKSPLFAINTIVQRSDIHLQIDFNEHTVDIYAPDVSRASCSCSSVSLCVHIISTILSLQQSLEAGSENEQPKQNIPKATHSVVTQTTSIPNDNGLKKLTLELLDECSTHLFSWAGKTNSKKVALWFAQKDTSLFNITTLAKTTSLEIYASDAEKCRFVSGAGLPGIVSDFNGSAHKEKVLKLLLQWLVSEDVKIPWPDYLGESKELGKLSETEKSILGEILQLIFRILEVGVMHLNQRFADTCMVLAYSGRGESLPRLAGMMLRLSEHIENQLKQGPEADSRAIVQMLLDIWQYICEIHSVDDTKRMSQLRGSLRRRYQPKKLGLLWVAGLHTYQKKSAIGVELSLFDVETTQSYRVNIGRWGQQAKTVNLHQLLSQTIGWHGSSNAAHMSGQFIELENALVSEDNKLSTSQNTQVKTVAYEGTTHPNLFDKITVSYWKDLHDNLSETLVTDGLKSAQGQYKLLKPTQFSDMAFDEYSQCWQGVIKDQDGKLLPLFLPASMSGKQRAQSFNKIVSHHVKNICALLVNISVNSGDIHITPVAITIEKREKLTHYNLYWAHEEKALTSLGKLSKWLNSNALIESKEFIHSYHKDNNHLSFLQVLQTLREQLLSRCELGLNCTYSLPVEVSKLLEMLNIYRCTELRQILFNALENSHPNNLMTALYALSLMSEQARLHNALNLKY